jgi:BetI-type transcriptional repressor, C-terminal
LRTIEDFGQPEHGIDRLLVSLHGWSHSQSDPELRAATRAAYRRLRELLADAVSRSQAAGHLGAGADPRAAADLLTSICLGFAAQRALAGDADVRAHVDALEALSPAQSAQSAQRAQRRDRSCLNEAMSSETRRRMDSRDGATLRALLRRSATAVAAARVAIGVAALVRPDVPSRPWVGTGAGDGPAGLAGRVFGRALGGRDLALGLATLVALSQLEPGESGAPGASGVSGVSGGPGGDGQKAVPRRALEAASLWVAAGALADALDVATSLASWRELPRLSRWLVVGSAAGASLTGAAGALALRPGSRRGAP